MARLCCISAFHGCLLVWAALWQRSHGFRVLSSSSELASAPTAVFEPYVRGQVGYFGDPANPDPERVNEGAPFSPDTPRVYFGGSLKRTLFCLCTCYLCGLLSNKWNHFVENCPGMVGPINNEEYYCHGRDYGYCDRRNGLCVCNQGYTGIDCTQCKPSYFNSGGLCYPKSACFI